MPVYENEKLECSFGLPDDLTFGQLEKFEEAVSEVRANAKFGITQTIVCRSAVEGVLRSGLLTAIDGLPNSIGEIDNLPAEKLLWMGRVIGRHMAEIREKAIDPN